MKLALLFCFCFSTIHLQAQSDVEFFTSGSMYTGLTKKVTTQNNYYTLDNLALIDLYFPSTPSPVNSESMLGMEFEVGLILRQKWYFSTGLRYDARRYSSCYYCNLSDQTTADLAQAVQSRAIEIPVSIQYRIIPDLPVSPMLSTETALPQPDPTVSVARINFNSEPVIWW